MAVFDARERRTRVNGQRLPRLQTILELLGKDLGIARDFEGFLRDFARDLVMAVAIGRSADKGGQDDLRPHHAHREHRVVKHAIVAPLGEGFFLGFGEAVVGLSAPQLLRAIILVGSEQLVGADETQRIVTLGRHGVQTAFAARKREQCDAHAEAAREIGHESAVFIVGMGDDEEHSGGGAQAFERLFEIGCAAVFR